MRKKLTSEEIRKNAAKGGKMRWRKKRRVESQNNYFGSFQVFYVFAFDRVYKTVIETVEKLSENPPIIAKIAK